MRVLLMYLVACLGAALGQPQTGGIYLPVAASDPSSRRYLPVGRGPPRQRNQNQPPRRPVFGGVAQLPPVVPDTQYRPVPFQTPEVPQYQPSSAEVPPNQPALSYQPDEQTTSRRYLPVAAGETTSRTRGRTTFHVPSAGSGNGPEREYPPANYDFEYNVLDDESGNDFGHREGRRGDLVTGRYRVTLPDGRTQVVEYVADVEGYRPVVSYEGAQNSLGTSGGYNYNKPGETDGGYNYNSPRLRF